MNKATDMFMISGIQASRVKRPSMINTEQKNSAKIVKDKEAVEPIPKGLAKLPAFWEKCSNLSNP